MIGKNIKKIRLKKGLTLHEVAKRLGKTHAHISVIESDKGMPKDKSVLDILVRGLDMPYSEAKKNLAVWKIQGVLEETIDHSDIINSVINSDNSIVINGNNNQISNVNLKK